jgi:hypothetical protein
MDGTPLTEFVPFPKLARLSRDCVITEKLDGTNAQVIVTDDFQLLTASRSKLITPSDDNHGFATWAEKNREQLIAQLGPGRHFGEWWGGSINKRYRGFAAEKRFSLFNTSRWEGCDGALFGVVPILYKGPFDTIAAESCLAELAQSGSRAAPGCTTPEGIVVFHVAANVMFKKTLGGDGHKGAE